MRHRNLYATHLNCFLKGILIGRGGELIDPRRPQKQSLTRATP